MMLALLAAASVSPEAAIGRWRTETKNSVVEVYHCGQMLCGRLITSDGLRADPNLRDVNNKDAAQRARKLAGLQFLSGFSWKSGAWADGTVYNPADGGTYHGTITPVDDDHLKLKGCIFWPLCKTESWTRAR